MLSLWALCPIVVLLGVDFIRHLLISVIPPQRCHSVEETCQPHLLHLLHFQRRLQCSHEKRRSVLQVWPVCCDAIRCGRDGTEPFSPSPLQFVCSVLGSLANMFAPWRRQALCRVSSIWETVIHDFLNVPAVCLPVKAFFTPADISLGELPSCLQVQIPDCCFPACQKWF